MTASAPAPSRPARRGRDYAWLVVAALLALLFAFSVVSGIIAMTDGQWAPLSGLPFTLLLVGWGTLGAWRRTTWGAQRRARADYRRWVDLRGFSLFVPGGNETYARKRGADLTLALRSIVIVLTILLGVIGSALASLPDKPSGAPALWLALLAVLAIASYATCGFITTRPLDCASDATLLAGYVSSACLRITFATSVAVYAYAFAVIGGAAWIYAAGAAISLLWLWLRVVPTGRTIARDQRRISAQGCERSLVTALEVKSA